MIRALPHVALCARQVDLPFQLRCVHRFVDHYNQTVQSSNSLCANDVALALLDGQAPRVSLVSRELAQEFVQPLASQMAFDGSKGQLSASVTSDTLARRLIDLISYDRQPSPGVQAFGAIAKHEPVNVLRSRFPDFKVVWVVRDPRDVLISWFYHDLRTMTPHKARHFIARPMWARLLHRMRMLDNQRVPLTLRCDWKRSYFSCRAEEVSNFCANGWIHRDNCLVVRYEDMLTNCREQLRRIVDFLGVTASEATLAKIEANYSFARLTGGSSEVVGGHIRRGQAGDWRNYFDSELQTSLPRKFVEWVGRLGYEDSNEWTKKIPALAVRPFEFHRLNVRGSAVRAMSEVWKADPILQKRFQQPVNDVGPESFFEWLSDSRQPRIRECLRQMNWLADQWGQLELLERPVGDQLISEHRFPRSKVA